LKEGFRDAVGGETNEVFEAKLAEQAATREAAAEIRDRAESVAAGKAGGVRGRQDEPRATGL
jgi:hypothetical protein